MPDKISIKNFVFICLLLSIVEAWAVQPYQPVQPDPVLEPWRWRSFPELKGHGLQCIAEDREGNMWFGIADGVIRYDGLNWTTFTLEDGPQEGSVNALCVARDGSVYAGTYQGIYRFKDGIWTHAFVPEEVQNLHVTDLLEASDGRIWAGTGYGALCLAQEKPQLYTIVETWQRYPNLHSQVVLSVVPDEMAYVYVPRPYEGIGISQTNGNITRVFPGGPAEAAGLAKGDSIIAVDGVSEAAVERGQAGTWVTLTILRGEQPDTLEVKIQRRRIEQQSVRSFWVYDLFEDREGVMWFGLRRREVVRYDTRVQAGDTTAWRHYTAEHGLDIGSRPRIAQTRDGTIWIGSVFEGDLNRFDGTTWTHFSLKDLGGSGEKSSLLETDNGTLWVGGSGALYAYRNSAWTVYEEPALPIPAVRIVGLLEASDEALWLACSGQEAVRLDLSASRWTTYEGLSFQCETPDGAHWYVSQDSGVVRFEPTDNIWMRYGIEDGLMDAPNRLVKTRKGTLWASGSHDSTAATARFDRKVWSRQTHPKLSWSIDERAVFESADGVLWFGAHVDLSSEKGHLGGMLQFDGETWTHHYNGPSYSYGLGQTSDGTLWSGGYGLTFFDGQVWRYVEEPEKLRQSFIDVVYSTPEGALWVGHRSYGAFHYDGQTWTRYGAQQGLSDGLIRSILQTDDGSVWIGTNKGMSRYDGQTWTTDVLPSELIPVNAGAGLRKAQDGLWINRSVKNKMLTTHVKLDTNPPETEITLSLDRVSQPGNTVLSWQGDDPWRETPKAELRFAWRRNGEPWSPFTLETNHVFLSLPSGNHTFEVKARDRDFNEDPTPAVVMFTVIPPVWQQPWFIGLEIVLLSGIILQTTRVIRRGRRLQEANAALSSANNELFQTNKNLETANQQIQEQTERKSAFLASMSHELRTPMNAIKGFTTLVIRRIGDTIPDRQRENLEKVTQASDHLLAMINDILDLSKIEAGQMDVNPEPFTVQSLVTYCCATVSPLVEEKPNITLEYEVTESIEKANTDQGRLRQMLINLLSNAIKFTDSGKVTVNAKQMDNQVVISVTDTGKGIPADEIDTIFDEYRQVKGSDKGHEGTGLGLSITKQFAELLSGSISEESEVGKGTTFTVQIPNVYKEA